MNNSDLVDHLLWLKFPTANLLLNGTPETQEEEETYLSLIQDIDRCRKRFEEMSVLELEIQVAAEEARIENERRELQVHEEESNRFFNRPSAKVDYLAWSVIGNWTLDQATALLLDRDPAVVTPAKVREHVDASEWARHYERVRAYLAAADIDFPIAPLTLVEWAHSHGVKIPPKLLELVRANASKSPLPDVRLERDERSLDGLGPHKREAAKEAILTLWPGPERPTGVTEKVMLERVNQRLLELRKLTVSKETLKRALKEARKTWAKSQRHDPI
jgi:hypothetical protein